ncbi:DUF302 domain-containing protein [Pengzhenrongella sp.]|jgi:uncharacterized protein (DUF302 family)|uniref:DUF302 domain-containing protein n=1 Tax=Pengzhenrongella sp. TaxID=2888820 RepID=UPI002F9276D3
MNYGIRTTLDQPFTQTLRAVRDALLGQGFGILTEIDMAATMKAKLDVDIAPQVILGACNPPLAYRALQAEESVGLLLPCNVVVRSAGGGRTTVEALDPHVMVAVTGNEQLGAVADDAALRLRAALGSLGGAAAVPAAQGRTSAGASSDAQAEDVLPGSQGTPASGAVAMPQP